MIPLPSPAAAYILATMLSCPVHPAPTVGVTFINTPPTMINTMGAAQLGKVKIDTVISRHRNETFITGGLTNGSIKGQFEMSYQTLTAADKSASCLWMDEINVTITYTPTVYIAAEYPPGTCKHDTTWLHELRHVNTDVITVNEFTPRIKAEVQTAVNALYAAGPFAPHQMESKKQVITKHLQAAMDQSFDRMNETRRQRQQLIDTRQEYLRLSKVCPP